ncbi:PAS domain S-box protein [Pseudomonas sp. 5P_3.1_Bac2]|uniref:PAS domain S-box protein n=1 Tax=Pseudomonas sp. 5P_3.1_Bac2 TaxID=2971617 RepID=UPI0021C8BCE3|nr:PAS domain S-box protein [Pseudomonas sp. 5P_3.1_Bac2]MCU1719394.1 PAS domain S-box protein [Pseudomonas sp. 5P_3.1_Bac2]
MQSDLKGSLRLAGLYVLLSALWIFCSDRVLSLLSNDVEFIQQLQTLKGLLFVLASALFLLFTSYHGRQKRRQVLQQLQNSQEHLQLSQAHSKQGSWSYQQDFQWSAAALRLLGRENLEQQPSLSELLSWLHPSERGNVQRALLALLEEKRELNVCVQLQAPHEQAPQVWLQLRGQVNEAGGICGTVQDISVQKHHEQALRQAEQRLRQLFGQTPRIAVQGYDRERRVIFWNQASTQLYGYSVQEAMGRRMEELIVPPQARRKVAVAANLWQLDGPPVAAGEVQLQRKDGGPVWVHSSHMTLRNSFDQLELYQIDIDLTEQKKMHAALQVSESRYRTLVEHLGDAIFITDEHNQLCFLNPAWCEISGYSSSESLGQNLSRFMPELGQTPLRQQLEELSSGLLNNLRLECQLLTRSGQVRRVELQLNVSLPERTLHGSLRDVHERHQAQQLQKARNAVLDELLAKHPLGEILTGISRGLEQLQPHMRVSIMLLDEHNQLRIGAAPSLPLEYCQAIDGIAAQHDVGSCGHAAASGELVIAEDLSSHPNWQHYAELATRAGLHACWSLPFKDDHGKVLGTFGIYYPQPTRPSHADIALVTEFTRLAGLALQFSATPQVAALN